MATATVNTATPVPPRIMVVEDEALIASDLERRLKRAGFDVVGVADNRDEAVALFEQEKPDLVMMDIFIQGDADGIETARAIGKLRDVPIIFLTAYADNETVKRAAATSPYGYLLKPFDERTLVATITLTLSRHAADMRLHLLESAVGSAGMGFGLVDVRGEKRLLSYCNPAFADIRGCSVENLLGQRPTFLAADPEDESVLRLQKAVDAREAAEEIIRGRRSDGSDLWASASLSPVQDRAGQVSHLLLFYKDITRQRETESALAEREAALASFARLETQLRQRGSELELALDSLRNTQRELIQQEKLASLGSLVAGLAHEVNTPLGVAVTAASIIQESVTTLKGQIASGQLRKSTMLELLSTVDEALATMDTNVRRSAELIRHFKTVAVDQSGNQERGFELGAYVDEVLASLAPLLKRSTATVRVEKVCPVEVVCQPGHLSQLVTNFVTNALMHAFTPDQAGELVIRVDQQDMQALLTVSDNGRGMPEDVAARAFDPFFTTRRGTGGSGLGLFIVHNLVTEALHGRIAVETAPGAGTTFRVQFPVRPPLGGSSSGPAVDTDRQS